VATAAGVGHQCDTFGPRAFGRRPLGLWAHPPGIAATSGKARRGSAGRASGGRVMLLRQSIAALTPFGLEGFDRETGLLHRAGHEPAYSVTLPAHGLHDLGNAGPALPLEHLDNLGRLAAPPHACGFR